MGTQQILLIVLSVIIVGIAVVVGIMMFNAQAYNANKQAVAAELTTYGSMIVQWWKTPTSQGGAGQVGANISDATIAPYVGFNPATPFNLINEDTGEFRIVAFATADSTVTMMGKGKENRGGNHPTVTTMIKLPLGEMKAVAEDKDATYWTPATITFP